MYCIYHSRDLDGWCSAAIVMKWFSEVKTENEELELIGWDYGDPIPKLKPRVNVIMCDISFPIEDMIRIDKSNILTWIDHHKSAIKEYNDNLREGYIDGSRDDKFAACELTWKHLFPSCEMPEFVRLLGRYDCFGHKGTDEEQDVLEFQYAARSYYKNPQDCYVALLNPNQESLVESIRGDGNAIYEYLCTDAEQDYKDRFEFELVELDGQITNTKKFACVNKKRFNPINFGINYHKDGYDGFACFHYANGYYNFSLYNDDGKTDCSVIAKGLGGGGHKGAAGFRVKEVSTIFNQKS